MPRTRGQGRQRPSVVAQRLPDLVALSHAIHADARTVLRRGPGRPVPWPRPSGPAASRSPRASTTAHRLRGPVGRRPAVVAICAEYDALPDVGHACGHNIIAASAVGAGLALAAVADQIGLQVRVLGTPAEEGGGGKVLMLERGAFEGAHAAMMVHPWPTERLTGACLAVAHFDVHFTGREAHASAAPWEGVNAARRHDGLPGGHRPAPPAAPPGRPGARGGHPGRAGGQRHPRRVTGRFMARLAHPRGARRRSSPGSAPASRPARWPPGCTVRYEKLSPDYSHMEADPALLAAYRTNAESLGRRFDADDAGRPAPHVLHRHGQRLAGRADHPSAHRHRVRRRGQPPARVRGRLHHRRRPTPPSATGRWPWPGRPSTPPPTRRCASGCSAHEAPTSPPARRA